MSAHLGPGEGEVHDAARAVLGFWFDEVGEARWFARDDALDRACAARFGAMRDDVLAADALGWRSEPDHLLAAIILLDQFSRNIYRDSPRAFEADALALDLARHCIGRGWHRTLAPSPAQFLLMPLMHAEDRDVARESVQRFEELGLADALEFARAHAAVIERFGRYPSRNAALGRASTPEEAWFLQDNGAGW
jgi:uncharacterized protein (DUF924 family)